MQVISAIPQIQKYTNKNFTCNPDTKSLPVIYKLYSKNNKTPPYIKLATISYQRKHYVVVSLA